jgi:hypothetical protein
MAFLLLTPLRDAVERSERTLCLGRVCALTDCCSPVQLPDFSRASCIMVELEDPGFCFDTQERKKGSALLRAQAAA